MKEVFQYIFPGMMTLWMFFIAQSAVADLFVEWESKTLRRLSATTAGINNIIFSKFIRSIALCLIAEMILVVLTWLMFGMHWGNPFLLIGFLCLFNLTITGVLSVIYSLSKSKEGANALGTIVILTSGIVGGCMFPYEEMPRFMKLFSDYSFCRWAIVGLQTLILDRPFSDMIHPSILLVSTGVLTCGFGIFMFKRRLESGEALS